MTCRIIVAFFLSVCMFGACLGQKTQKKLSAPSKEKISQKAPLPVAISPTPTPVPVPCANGAAAVAPPINPWIQPSIGMAQILVTAVLAFVLWRLTFFAFVGTSEQKINERHGAWFHKVVVDPQLDNLKVFADEANKLLSESAHSCEAVKSANDIQELERRVEVAIGSFNDLLLPTQSSLSDSVNCFDQTLAAECTDRCGRLQDEVTMWFERLLQQPDIDTTVSLPSLVGIFRSDIISKLRNYEFATYGFERPTGLLHHISGGRNRREAEPQ